MKNPDNSGIFLRRTLHTKDVSVKIESTNEKRPGLDTFKRRLVAGLIMVAGLLIFIALGPFYIVIGVALIQLAVFREVISLMHAKYFGVNSNKWFNASLWTFLFTLLYYLYGDGIYNYYIAHHEASETFSVVLSLSKYHKLISFLGYSLALVLFVMNLKKGYYKSQFAQFGITHVALLLVVIQAFFVNSNILEGLIWFVLPVSIVVTNDISAYVIGKILGRTPLIMISPKKTLEGFLGALLVTIVYAFFSSKVMANIPYLVCRAKSSVFFNISNYNSECSSEELSSEISRLTAALFEIEWLRLKLSYIQAHAIIMAIFGSLVAPFGGFFASGFKRAFKLKDFGEIIPGHGGVTDRMDCQFLMAVFSNIYHRSFIMHRTLNVDDIFIQIVQHLNRQDQLVLLGKIETHILKTEYAN